MYTVLGHNKCHFCKQAIQLLAEKGESFQYLDAYQTEQADRVSQLKEKGIQSVPQIWIGEELIGGFSELKSHISGQ